MMKNVGGSNVCDREERVAHIERERERDVYTKREPNIVGIL